MGVSSVMGNLITAPLESPPRLQVMGTGSALYTSPPGLGFGDSPSPAVAVVDAYMEPSLPLLPTPLQASSVAPGAVMEAAFPPPPGLSISPS
eukprot:11177815-Prorocentrum_lima.AAC.1